eukprot:1143859-Pelagomonas_calceolata.AAC.7
MPCPLYPPLCPAQADLWSLHACCCCCWPATVCRGVGFVNYVDSTSAVRASQLVHGTRIAEGRQVHVTLQVGEIWLTGLVSQVK